MSNPPPDLKSALAILLRGGREALKLGSFDLAETLAREVLALPIYPELTEAQQAAVVNAIGTFGRG